MSETKTIKLRCESCGASLTAKEGKEFMYCEHCGTKIYLVAKQEIKHIYLDETKIRQTELDAEAKLKQAQLDAQLEREREERKKGEAKTSSMGKLILTLALLGLSLFLFIWPFTGTDYFGRFDQNQAYNIIFTGPLGIGWLYQFIF